MIGWTRLVLVTAWVTSTSLGCAGATPRPSTPTYIRSSQVESYYRAPRLDYVELPRSASDGEVLGAHQHQPDDWLSVSATSSHLAPGWSMRYGQLRFDRERARAGRGVLLEAASCPPSRPPLTPDEAEHYAVLRRAWLAATSDPALPELASAVPDVPGEPSGFLSCEQR